MPTILLIAVMIILPSIANASEIIPPYMLLVQTIEHLKKPNRPADHWAVDYIRIQQNNPKLEKEKVVDMLKSIDTDKIELAPHDDLAVALEMIRPMHLIFHYEARDTQYTNGPPTFYVLIKIEDKEP